MSNLDQHQCLRRPSGQVPSRLMGHRRLVSRQSGQSSISHGQSWPTGCIPAPYASCKIDHLAQPPKASSQAEHKPSHCSASARDSPAGMDSLDLQPGSMAVCECWIQQLSPRSSQHCAQAQPISLSGEEPCRWVLCCDWRGDQEVNAGDQC